MNHIIISGALLLTALAGHFLQDFFTAKWQKENELIVMETKILHGIEYTAYPKNHTFIEFCLLISTAASFGYLLTSVLLLFFVE